MKPFFIMRNRGFTLIEVLAALAIISILLAALYSTFTLSNRAMDAMDESVLRLQEMRNAMDVIRREMESSFYSADNPHTLFKADDRYYYGRPASRLTFTAYSPLRPSVSRITYMAEEEKGRLVLKKKAGSAFDNRKDAPSVEVMTDIESFSTEVNYDNKWVKAWDTGIAAKMPDEIRITVRVYKKGHGSDSPGAVRDKEVFSVTRTIRPRIAKAL